LRGWFIESPKGDIEALRTRFQALDVRLIDS
jgi:hypothetical protein